MQILNLDYVSLTWPQEHTRAHWAEWKEGTSLWLQFAIEVILRRDNPSTDHEEIIIFHII